MSAFGSPEFAPPRTASPDGSLTDTFESATAAPACRGVRTGAAPRVISAATAPAARRKEAAGMGYLQKDEGPSDVARAPAWGLSGVYRFAAGPNLQEPDIWPRTFSSSTIS